MKFGSWTYDGLRLDLVPEGHPGKCIGDIKKFIRHGEWDLTNMPCNRNELVYACCPEPYPDITYTMELRRRHMFYFVNLIAPCFLISGLSEFSRALVYIFLISYSKCSSYWAMPASIGCSKSPFLESLENFIQWINLSCTPTHRVEWLLFSRHILTVHKTPQWKEKKSTRVTFCSRFFFTWFSEKSFYHVKKSTFYYSEIAVVSSLLHHVTFLHFLSHCDAFIQLSRSNCPPSWLINMCKRLANLPDVTDSIAWITTYPAG